MIDPPLRAVADDLHRHGIATFPCSETAKHPDLGVKRPGEDGRCIPRWSRAFYPDGLPTDDQHRANWRAAGERGVRGFAACGLIRPGQAGRLISLDFDLADAFAAFLGSLDPAQRRLVESLYRERSQRKGNTHLACFIDDPPRSFCPARTGARAVIVEIRGAGGGFIFAPSTGYERVSDIPIWDAPHITTDEYEALMAALFALNEYVAPAPIWTPTPRTFGIDTDGDRPGDEYNRTHGQQDVVDLLVGAGWQVVGSHGDCVQLRRPGNPRSASSGSVDPNGVFVCWSQAVPDFEQGQPYAPFAVYTVINHGGDFSAAARAIGRKNNEVTFYGFAR